MSDQRSIDELVARIVELEKRVRDLEARPAHVPWRVHACHPWVAPFIYGQWTQSNIGKSI